MSGILQASFMLSSGTWQNVFTAPTLDGADNGGWSGFTLRQIIGSAQMTFPAATSKIRITIQAGAGEGVVIDSAYVDNAAASGDAYDFNGTNGGSAYQIKWGGSASKTISSGTTAVSDEITFSRVAGRALVISMHMPNSTDTFAAKATLTGWSNAFLSGSNDSATVNTSGYSAGGQAVIGIKLVEAFG